MAPSRKVDLELRESGDPGAPHALVGIHGLMADGTVYRYMRGDLAGQYRFITVDLPGCGRSDAPDPRQLGRGAYSPLWLARCVLAALCEHLRESPAVERITLVGHSLGGMVILRMLSDPDLRAAFAEVIELVDSAVLFTPIDVAIEKDQPLFGKLHSLPHQHRS